MKCLYCESEDLEVYYDDWTDSYHTDPVCYVCQEMNYYQDIEDEGE